MGEGRGSQEHPQGIPYMVEPKSQVLLYALGYEQSPFQALEETQHT